MCSLQSEIIVVPSGVKKSGSNGSQIMKRSGRKRKIEKMSMVKMASVVGVVSKRERERDNRKTEIIVGISVIIRSSSVVCYQTSGEDLAS